jgi:hypothetical protein
MIRRTVPRFQVVARLDEVGLGCGQPADQQGKAHVQFTHRNIGAASCRELWALLLAVGGTLDGAHSLQQLGYPPRLQSAFLLPDGC